MRIFLSLLTTLFILTGCSKSTAFDPFNMDDEHDRAFTNLRTATIVNNNKTKAIISTIYLNNTLPETYREDGEYFLVALYLEDDIHFGTKSSSLTMNRHAPVAIEEIDKEDSLRSLMPIKNEWNRYYLITYLADDSPVLTLTFESGLYGSAVLTYQKDEQ